MHTQTKCHKVVSNKKKQTIPKQISVHCAFKIFVTIHMSRFTVCMLAIRTRIIVLNPNIVFFPMFFMFEFWISFSYLSCRCATILKANFMIRIKESDSLGHDCESWSHKFSMCVLCAEIKFIFHKSSSQGPALIVWHHGVSYAFYAFYAWWIYFPLCVVGLFSVCIWCLTLDISVCLSGFTGVLGP